MSRTSLSQIHQFIEGYSSGKFWIGIDVHEVILWLYSGKMGCLTPGLRQQIQYDWLNNSKDYPLQYPALSMSPVPPGLGWLVPLKRPISLSI